MQTGRVLEFYDTFRACQSHPASSSPGRPGALLYLKNLAQSVMWPQEREILTPHLLRENDKWGFYSSELQVRKCFVCVTLKEKKKKESKGDFPFVQPETQPWRMGVIHVTLCGPSSDMNRWLALCFPICHYVTTATRAIPLLGGD